MKDLESNLQAFSLGQLQDFKTIAIVLLRSGASLEDFIEYAKAKTKPVVNLESRKSAIKKCPNCSRIMGLFPVNTQPGDQTGDDSNSVWFCPGCLFENFNKETIKQITSKRRS